MGTATPRLSFVRKELVSVVREAQAEGLLRDRGPVGGRAPDPGLGWSGRLA